MKKTNKDFGGRIKHNQYDIFQKEKFSPLRFSVPAHYLPHRTKQ